MNMNFLPPDQLAAGVDTLGPLIKLIASDAKTYAARVDELIKLRSGNGERAVPSIRIRLITESRPRDRAAHAQGSSDTCRDPSSAGNRQYGAACEALQPKPCPLF
jgi:hypothetical protein